MEVTLTDVEDRFENLFWRNGVSVGLLFEINRHLFLTLLYYLAKERFFICDLLWIVKFSNIISLMHIFRKVREYKLRVLVSLQPLSETFTVRRNERIVISNEYVPSCKVPVIIVKFSQQIFEIHSSTNFQNIFVKCELRRSMLTDGHTNRTK